MRLMFLLAGLLLFGCCGPIDEVTEEQYICPDDSIVSDPADCPPDGEDQLSEEYSVTLEEAQPYISEIVFEDINLRSQATAMVRDCPSGDKDCHVTGIYRHVVVNYDYYADPRSSEFIQSPEETMDVKGGDCEDLSILLNSLLENVGVKTYLVLTETHAYSLACGVDTDQLWHYIDESLVEQMAKDSDLTSVDNKTFILEDGYFYYFGGDGSSFEGTRTAYMDVRYDIKSSQPLHLYVVPSPDDYEAMLDRETFNHYPDCEQEDILEYTGSCDGLSQFGRVVLENTGSGDATLDLEIVMYRHPSIYEIYKNESISYYEIDGEECVVLDATAGPYGYPGFDANLEEEKLAIDPITLETIELT